VQEATSFDAPVTQAQLSAFPNGVEHWLALHSPENLQAPIMQQYLPAPSVVQSQMQGTSCDQRFDQNLVHQASSKYAAEGSSVQSIKCKAVIGDGVERTKQQKNTRIHPDNDPEFVSQFYILGSRHLIDDCFISNKSSRTGRSYTSA
jgi:hypothetical protein